MICVRCNAQFDSNLSQCTSCGKWHTGGDDGNAVYMLSDLIPSDVERTMSGPWDSVWGGGIANTSITLLGGEPGAGKSTLMLQIAGNVPGTLYISAEEEPGQIKGRANRLGIEGKDTMIAPAIGGYFNVEASIKRLTPSLVIIDSLTALVGENLQDNVELIRMLKVQATLLECPVILISHINKQEKFAGFIKIEHLVDTTISFFTTIGEEEEFGDRLLKTRKNRHGAPAKVYLNMTDKGLVIG